MLGIESNQEQAIPVIRFVAPGPLVATVTPIFPVVLQIASAAIAAACSCWKQTISELGFLPNASTINAQAPPVTRKALLEHFSATKSAIKSAPVYSLEIGSNFVAFLD